MPFYRARLMAKREDRLIPWCLRELTTGRTIVLLD